METIKLITSSYSEIAGFGMLRGFGSSVLWIALAAYMVIELYRLYTTGRADFFTPLIKIGAALAILNALPAIGDFLSQSMCHLADLMFEENVQQLAAKTWAIAFKNADPGILDYVKAIFSPVAWICLFTYLQLIGIMIIKFAVIDVIWPVMLGLTVFSGLLAVPIGVLPGVNSFKGWMMNVLEISIWPLVFQMLTTLLFGVFAGQLDRLCAMEKVWEQIDELEEKAALAEFRGNEDEAERIRAQINHESDGPMFTMFRYLAINAAFGFLCIFTPFISRKIVRGESAGFLGGVAAAVATRLIAKAGMGIGRKVLGRSNNSSNHYSNGESKNANQVNSQKEQKDPAETLDQRVSPGHAGGSSIAGSEHTRSKGAFS